MKHLAVGDKIRLSVNLYGIVQEIDERRVLVYWKRGKGLLVRMRGRFFPIGDVIPSDEADQEIGIHWRLQFYLDDARGALTDDNKSMPDPPPRKPWTPYTG